MMFPPQLETTSELVYALGGDTNDRPVYARTPHGSYHFVIERVEQVHHNGEERDVLVLREVEW